MNALEYLAAAIAAAAVVWLVLVIVGRNYINVDRAAYVRWAKRRALHHLDAGDLPLAVQSMVDDLNDRADTFVHPELAWLAVKHCQTREPERVRRWIEGFR